jgi:hypothetical protein
MESFIGRSNEGRMRWAGHVARMGVGTNLYRVLVESPKVGDHLKGQGVDGIRTHLTETGWGVWSGLKWLKIGNGGGLL